MYAHMHALRHVEMYVCMHLRKDACTIASMHACIYVCGRSFTACLFVGVLARVPLRLCVCYLIVCGVFGCLDFCTFACLFT